MWYKIGNIQIFLLINVSERSAWYSAMWGDCQDLASLCLEDLIKEEWSELF